MTRVGTEEDRPGEELPGPTASGCCRAGSSYGVGAWQLQDPSLPSGGCTWVLLASCSSQFVRWGQPSGSQLSPLLLYIWWAPDRGFCFVSYKISLDSYKTI